MPDLADIAPALTDAAVVHLSAILPLVAAGAAGIFGKSGC